MCSGALGDVIWITFRGQLPPCLWIAQTKFTMDCLPSKAAAGIAGQSAAGPERFHAQ